jgi:hypothetical protein
LNGGSQNDTTISKSLEPITVILFSKTVFTKLGVMIHTCNPSYSGDRDWENYSSKPAQAKRY